MNEQIILSSTIVILLCLFIWGKVRYDALAIGALFVLVVFEIIPANEAFAGFAHPAVITVALKRLFLHASRRGLVLSMTLVPLQSGLL